MPLEFTLSSIWSTSRMKVFLQISGPTSFFVSLYLCIFLCISFIYVKIHLKRQRSSEEQQFLDFWPNIFDWRNSSDKMWAMWYPGESIGWPDNAQCAICRLFVKVNWSCSIPEPPFWEFLPPSPELSCPIYFYTQQSLEKYATLIKNDGRSWCGDRLLGLSWSWFPFWSGLAIRPFVVVSII